MKIVSKHFNSAELILMLLQMIESQFKKDKNIKRIKANWWLVYTGRSLCKIASHSYVAFKTRGPTLPKPIS